jgi:hypothetical protein
MHCLPLMLLLMAAAQVAAASESDVPISPREQELLDRIQKLEQRLAALEAKLGAAPAQAASPASVQATEPQTAPPDPGLPSLLRDTTFNMTLDGYYGYNFNRPVGRINLLRAYDVLSNSLSLNQAAIVVERAPDPNSGRRFGMRLDLQYGQATETLQGSAVNEPRPQVYRPVFQAYGTYVLPVGSGLTVDFGKWASALGIENNYTKDQFNYSRSYFFNFLPFYHFGFRTSYNATSWLNVNYWLVNGAQQSEDFNGFKSQALLLSLKPAKSLSWNVSYYTGIEDRDTRPVVSHVPGRRLHIIDSYATWHLTSKLTLAGEADYVTHRGQNPAPHVAGGAAYARYQFAQWFALAGRAEYLSDQGGLFSGTTLALKETTLTADYRVAEGFLVRGEWRRDFSNRPFFLTQTPDFLKREQNTATLGLIWWFGGKQGAW